MTQGFLGRGRLDDFQEKTTGFTMVAGEKYATSSGSRVHAALPTANATVGSTLELSNGQNAAGGWRVTQAAGQSIILPDGTSTTTGSGGYIESTQPESTVMLVCVTANTIWRVVRTGGEFVDQSGNPFGINPSLNGANVDTAASANSVAKRDGAGRLKAATPSASDDVATKGYALAADGSDPISGDQFTVVDNEGLVVRRIPGETVSTKWWKIARISNVAGNPTAAGESTSITGTLYCQRDFGGAGNQQGSIHFSFGVRPNITPAIFVTGDAKPDGNTARPYFTVWEHADGHHYLYYRQPSFSKFSTFVFSGTNNATLYFVEEDPSGVSGATKRWDSATDAYQDVHVGNDKVWHQGNDGAGSGLDADLLDGQQPATAATANTIAQRDSNGRIKAATGVANDDVAVVGQLGGNLTEVDSATGSGGDLGLTMTFQEVPVLEVTPTNTGLQFYEYNFELQAGDNGTVDGYRVEVEVRQGATVIINIVHDVGSGGSVSRQSFAATRTLNLTGGTPVKVYAKSNWTGSAANYSQFGRDNSFAKIVEVS